ncbi:MAG: RNA polymerase-associated protein RapA [Methylococcales bacterium]
MSDFIPGQRWISNTESELGLGLVLDVEFNRVSMLFLACGEKRLYAADNAPLTRVRFVEGDAIESAEGEQLLVQEVLDQSGLLTYLCSDSHGKSVRLEEMELNHHIQFNKPYDRLFAGQMDPDAWFLLRYETWRRLQQHQQAAFKGLQGGRTSLLAHQLFIAHEAANRLAPRIMLADEVGLGKTIEAGLIVHYRLLHGLSRRVLVIVPESLLHQWLVEMLRRFNLRFSVFDEERCVEASDDNPFMTEQLVLCSQGFFERYPLRQEQALQADWDMVVVDEAHHLEWNEHAPSAGYQFVEQLSLLTPSLILLTATPEQLGKESHFARLRLLDPDRFYSFKAFLAEEQQFEPVAEVAKSLLAGHELNRKAQSALKKLLKEDNVDALLAQINDAEAAPAARDALLNVLLDHHGTGRILFRNSRHTVEGFPERECHGYPLTGKASEDILTDVRFDWLVDKLKQLKKQKVLLICKQAELAIALEQGLKNRMGLPAAVFHEGMSIIERDRAAAYFADHEGSARLLICSEIGSEGRNFQFVQHLILFDLPTNPDLLQQRIGRLDRIGQQHVIQIHVPYIQNTPQEVLFRWYHEGMNAFRVNCSGAQRVADEQKDALSKILASTDQKQIDAFIAQTHDLSVAIEAQMHQGRDQLLELNSCRTEVANALIAQIEQEEQAASLWPYFESLLDCYGVDVELHSPDCYILCPSEHLRIAHFPLLTEDGLTVTVKRDIALVREDMQFLTQEHPMVTAAMDLVLSSDTGNAAVSAVTHTQLQEGQFLLELLFIVECSAPARLQISRFLPHTPIRVLIDQNLRDLTETISHASLITTGDSFEGHQVSAFLNTQRGQITKMLELARQKAKMEMEAITLQANKVMLESLGSEIKRLARLKKVNSSIKEDEIEQIKDVVRLSYSNIQDAQIRLDAVRFIVTS